MLEWKNLCVGYGRREVLQDASLSLNTGELVVLIGPNGCGKSTLLRTLPGLVSPRAGEILVDGEGRESFSPSRLAQRVAYLAQSRELPEMTVEQLVLHGRFPYLRYPRRYRAEDRRIAREALETLGLLQDAERRLSELSGGGRQLAYLAMALAQDTDYVLLDEPTTYLDVSHAIELMRALRTLRERGKGILCVMHDLPLAFSFADRVAVMEVGGAITVGEPRALCETDLIERVFGVALCRAPDGSYYLPTARK